MSKAKTQVNSLKLLQDQSHIDIEESIELRKNRNLLIDRAYELIHEENFDHAYRLLCMGLEDDDQDPDLLNGLGVVLCEMGRLNDSMLILHRAIRYNPDDAVTFANLAGVCWELEMFDRAIYYYTKSLETDPEIEDVYFNLINLYLEIDSIFMAFITCISYSENFPESLDAKELLEDIILNLGLMMF